MFIMRLSVLFFTLIIVFLAGCVAESSPLPPADDYQPKQVCFDSMCVFVEVADTPFSREVGLMNRDTLADNYGMLFVFDEEKIHPFWMKNTLIPLDAFWINGKYQIIDIQTMMPCEADPCMVYTPAQISLYVLEVPAGFAQTHKIHVGDFIQFKGV